MMNTETKVFTLQVDGVKGVCPAAEAWAEQQIREKKTPVLACESSCVRGDIARRAANFVVQEGPFARACYAETLVVPHSAMARWVQRADKVVMIDGCFLKCIGRILSNLVEPEKIVHVDAMQYYHKYTDVFYMEDVPEAERSATAHRVARRIAPILKESVAVATKAGDGNGAGLDGSLQETIATSSDA